MSEFISKPIHPGLIIKDSLEEWDMPNKEFSFRTGISERTLSDLISEKGNITFDIATKLAEYYGNSIEGWLNLQASYDKKMMRVIERDAALADYELIKPIKEYIFSRNLSSVTKDKEELVNNVRNSLKVNHLTNLKEADFVVSYKEQKDDNADLFRKNFWIVYALTEARKNDTKEFNKNKLLLSIKELKSLTITEPSYFIPRLKNILSECGVSFVYVPYLAKSNIYGVTKWMSSKKVMLALSNRNERADMFWFTFFHELSHVIFEHKRYYCIQGPNIKDDQADSLAKDLLIEKAHWNKFIAKGDYSIKAIENFAKDENVLPMIVVGRLQKEKLVGYGDLYKAFYKSYDELDLYKKA